MSLHRKLPQIISRHIYIGVCVCVCVCVCVLTHVLLNVRELIYKKYVCTYAYIHIHGLQTRKHRQNETYVICIYLYMCKETNIHIYIYIGLFEFKPSANSAAYLNCVKVTRLQTWLRKPKGMLKRIQKQIMEILALIVWLVRHVICIVQKQIGNRLR